MTDVLMPSLGADMEYGTLIKWLVEPGVPVKRGDVVAEVETQKGVVQIEVFRDGVVGELVVQPPARVRVGAVLAHLSEGVSVGAKPVPSAAPERPVVVREVAPAPAPAVTTAPPPSTREVIPGTAVPRRPRASPLAQRIAAELHVDLSQVTGTGEGGIITRADVERVASAAAPPAAAPERRRAPGMEPGIRQAIAAAMTRANREIPHYYLAADIPLHRLTVWLVERNATRPPAERLVPAALLLKAVALALRDAPDLNGFWTDGDFRPSASIHLGVAISLRAGGLIAPAIHDVDHLAIDDVMRALRDLVERTRTGKLRSSELTDATITVTNLGERGAQSVFGVIYPPQVALVGFGRIVERPWAEDGMVGVRPVVTATLAGDHRASDGHRGGLFLAAVERLLQRPDDL